MQSLCVAGAGRGVNGARVSGRGAREGRSKPPMIRCGAGLVMAGGGRRQAAPARAGAGSVERRQRQVGGRVMPQSKLGLVRRGSAMLGSGGESTSTQSAAPAPALRARLVTTRAVGGSFDESPEAEVVVSGGDAEAEKPSYTTVIAWVGAACAFGGVIGLTQGADKASEFFAGYLLEQSLSVDNLFVFVLVFDYFKVPDAYQPRVLSYGIWGAAVMRAVMILAGYEAITKFEPILLVFAGILIFSSYKLLTGDEDEDEDMNENAIVKFCSNLIPVTDKYDGQNFFTTVDGVKMATPLLLVLAVVEISDVVFAVDSIPAVFGVTKDPFIVYSSNMFAILGLRSLYTFVSSSVADLEYLQTAVAAVLGFIGVKMVVEFGGIHISTEASLAIVATLLAGGVGASLLLEDKSDDDSSSEDAK